GLRVYKVTEFRRVLFRSAPRRPQPHPGRAPPGRQQERRSILGSAPGSRTAADSWLSFDVLVQEDAEAFHTAVQQLGHGTFAAPQIGRASCRDRVWVRVGV